MKKISFVAFFLLASFFGMSQELANQGAKVDRGTTVRMVTTQGEIVIRLYNETPMHRDNFVKLVSDGFYDGLLFHRVIERFMIQGGDPASRDADPSTRLGEGSLDYKVPAEFRRELFHKRGALCAARLGDDVNPKKESSACQFYIVQGQKFRPEQLDEIERRFGKKFSPEQRKAYTTIGGAPHLDGDYTVFGEVVKGMEVVDKIASLPKDEFDRPKEDVRILHVEMVQ